MVAIPQAHIITLQLRRTGCQPITLGHVLDISINTERDIIEVSEFDPRKRNPDRTPWKVLAAWLTLTKPPPKTVPDLSRVGRRFR